MYRLVLAVVGPIIGLAACTQTENDRPATLEYITEAILQPSCAQHVCHSSFRMEKGYAFDTVEAARRSLNSGIVIKGDSESSILVIALTRTVKRMPYDSPLPSKDIELIKRWIDGGGEGLDQ